MQLTTVQNYDNRESLCILISWPRARHLVYLFYLFYYSYFKRTVSNAEIAIVPITHGSSPELSVALVQTPSRQTS